jgi:hypothetical protein
MHISTRNGAFPKGEIIVWVCVEVYSKTYVEKDLEIYPNINQNAV